MSQDAIRVVCRLRPLNKIEIANEGVQCIDYSDKNMTISIGNSEQPSNKYSFGFDKIFGPGTQQVEVYREVATPVIKAVVSGFNGTIFAYGQTGGGKTWTMEGPSHTDAQFKGLIPRTIQGLFQGISEAQQDLQFLIKCSYIEIYNEKLYDLLDPSKARLDIKEDKQRGVFIQNCSEICVSSPQQMLTTMDKGALNRKVAFTGMNQRSSRSHSIFIIYLNQKHLKKNSTKQAKLYFVDLAGSEKVGKTGCVGQQLEEAKNINKSLSALGNVINALTSEKKEHVPYRDSKLTRILQQSLGGNSKTTLIINCSMCTYNDKQTLSTLRFGYRAKSIKNKPKVNQEKSAKELMILLDAANRTIAELKVKINGGVVLMDQGGEQTDEKEESRQMQQLKIEYEETIASLKAQLGSHRQEQEQRMKEMELRIKQLLLEVSRQKNEKQEHLVECKANYRMLSYHLNSVYKFIKRSYFDLEYMMNNVLTHFKPQESETESNSPQKSRKSSYQNNHYHETKRTLESTFANIDEFSAYFEKSIKPILAEIESQEEKKEKEKQDGISHIPYLTSPRNQLDNKKRIKIALSEPALFPEDSTKNKFNEGNQSFMPPEQLQMSCIVQQQPNEEFTNSQSDPISQQGSFSQIETFLESLQTKESHKLILEQMSNSMKNLKKENEQLKKNVEKLIEQKVNLIKKVEDVFSEKIMELEERVEEYKNVLGRKDVLITGLVDEKQNLTKLFNEERIVTQRYNKIIQEGKSLKKYSEMEEKVRMLATERQKLYNEMYRMRGQLDEADLNVKEKDEHIQSLKSVMKELEQQMMEKSVVMNTSGEIQKMYNAQVFGHQLPNVVRTVKGGGNTARKSTLRKKMQMNAQKDNQIPVNSNSKQKGGAFVPFIKSFFG